MEWDTGNDRGGRLRSDYDEILIYELKREGREQWRAMKARVNAQNARGTTEEAHASAPRRESAGEDASEASGRPSTLDEHHWLSPNEGPPKAASESRSR